MVENICNEATLSNLKNDAENFKTKLEECSGNFYDKFSLQKIHEKVYAFMDKEYRYTITGISKEKMYNYNTIANWDHTEYNKIFGSQNNCKDNDDNNLNCLEKEIDNKIKANNVIIDQIKDISGSKKVYYKFIDLLEKAQNTGDASEPRKKVRKQLLHNTNLLAFIYLSAILGGSYYIYRYLKK